VKLATVIEMIASKQEHRIGVIIAASLGGLLGLYHAVSHAYHAPSVSYYFTYVSNQGWFWNFDFYLLCIVWIAVGAVIAGALACIVRLIRV
jgi:hypothetical protein